MEPIKSVEKFTSEIPHTVNASLAFIHKIADDGPSSFKKNSAILLGRKVLQIRGEKVPLNLVQTIHFLAQEHVQKLLTSGTTADAKKIFDLLIEDLRHIKSYLKAVEFADDQEAKNLLDEISRVNKRLNPKSKKRAHSEVEQVQLSPKVMALVGGNKNIVSSLWKLGFIEITPDMCLRFSKGLEHAIDDDSLQLILETEVEHGEDNPTLAGVTSIDLSEYPYLEANAPALLVKHLSNLDRACFHTIAKLPRFLDYSVTVGNERIATNKALLLEESEAIQFLADETGGQVEISDPNISNETIKLFFKILISEQSIATLSLLKLCEVAIFAEKYDCKHILALIEAHINSLDHSYKHNVEELPVLLATYKTMSSRQGLNSLRDYLVSPLQNACKCLLVSKIEEQLKLWSKLPNPIELSDLYGHLLLEIVTEYQTEYPDLCFTWLESELIRDGFYGFDHFTHTDEKDFYSNKNVQLTTHNQAIAMYTYSIVDSSCYLDLMLRLGALCEATVQAVDKRDSILSRYHCTMGRIYSSGAKSVKADGQLAEKHLHIARELTKNHFYVNYWPLLLLVKLYINGAPGLAPDFAKAKEALEAIPKDHTHDEIMYNEIDLALRLQPVPDYLSLLKTTRLKQFTSETGQHFMKAPRIPPVQVVAFLFCKALLSKCNSETYIFTDPTKEKKFTKGIELMGKFLFMNFRKTIEEMQARGPMSNSSLLLDILKVLLVSALKRKLIVEDFVFAPFTATSELEPLLVKMERTAALLEKTIQYSPCGHIFAELFVAARTAANLTNPKTVDG